MIDFKQAEKRIEALAAERAAAQAAVEREAMACLGAQVELRDLEQARAVSQAVAEELQNRAHSRIARVVSRCLQAVFDEPYEFRITFEQRRGKTEPVLEFVRDGVTYADPINEVGGGVLDVAATALRLACVLSSNPPSRRVFVLDEPWTNIRGKGNRDRTRHMLTVLAEEFEVQWIVNTDIPSYRIGKVLELPSPGKD